MPLAIVLASLWTYSVGLGLEVLYCDYHPQADACKSYCAYHQCQPNPYHVCNWADENGDVVMCKEPVSPRTLAPTR